MKWWHLAVVVAALVVGWLHRGPSPDPSDEMVRLARQAAVAEADAAEARRVAMAYGDSVIVARREAERVAAEAARRVATARQAATDAEGRLRAALDSLGAPTANLDALIAAHAAEVLAIRDELHAVTVERDRLRTYAETLVDALAKTERERDAVQAERDLLAGKIQSANRKAQVGTVIGVAGVAVAVLERLIG